MNTEERVAFAVGLVIVATALVLGVLTFIANPDLAKAGAAQVAAHAFLGRETGVPMGIALGVPRLVVGLLAAMQDVTILLIGYTLVITLGRRVSMLGFLDQAVHKPHPLRDAFAKKTKAGGIATLAVSLWIPFFPGGALLAALLARAAGYPPRLFLPILAASAVIADVMYVTLVGELAARFGVWPVVAVSFGIVATVSLLAFVRGRLKSRADSGSVPAGDSQEGP